MGTIKIKGIIYAVLFLGLLQSCMMATVNTSEQMLGQWQSSLGGFPIVIEYTEGLVKVGNHDAVPYQLVGDTLSFPEGGSQEITISFISKDEMVQEDQLTGTRQILTRSP
ncbi:MAG: hypothetical protein JKY88_12455 [Pseudomonadales bacterium]|nr:hypothetical protein [Pseudomonadales bacterium]